MVLLIDHNSLQRKFIQFLDGYSEYYFATAWAGIDSEPYERLLLHRQRIRRLVVGIHFYQTHPDFMQALHQQPGVRFMHQPDGTFHPKVYLFQNSEDDWALLVGSANFTRAAFSSNTEATLLVTSADADSEGLRQQALDLIELAWDDAKVHDPQDVTNYRSTWERMRPKRESLGNSYGSTSSAPPVHDVPLLQMDWVQYMERLNAMPQGELDQRLAMLSQVHELFAEYGELEHMPRADRRRVAGVAGVDGQLDWNLFGNMRGSGDFHHWVLEDPSRISEPLQEIPLSGQVTRTHFERFRERFMLSTGMARPHAVATRLLAMKRPDVFLGLTSANVAGLAADLGVRIGQIKLDTYWDVVIARIQDAEWWQHPAPANAQERQIEAARAAFLDVLYYQP